MYHVLNRGNGRMDIFHNNEDFKAFLTVLGEAVARYPVDLLAWCLMTNHWHLVLRPRKAQALAEFMRWVGVTHVRRYREHYHQRGGGHLYQGRFKSFPVQSDHHHLTVCRYVEANPLRARMVRRAENWMWSSLGYRPSQTPLVQCSRWPVARPGNWLELVNEPLLREQVEAVRLSVNRGRPFGGERWVRRVAKQSGLESTLRPVGRPRKIAAGK